MPIVEPNAKSRVGQQLKDRAFKFDQVFFCQAVLLAGQGRRSAPALDWSMVYTGRRLTAETRPR